MTRFDEIDLERTEGSSPSDEDGTGILQSAPRLRRIFAFLVDVSLFLALGVAMSPLLPRRANLTQLLEHDVLVTTAFAGFILLFSYYYFVVSWLIWGKTVGGAIFEVQVVREDGSPIDFPCASRRWLATLLTIVTAGIGFVPLVFPYARTLPDRMSSSVPISDS